MIDILIIEDDAELGKILGDFLQAEGFTFCHCKSGEEGLRFLEDDDAGIVLLDILLPGLDGLEVCKKIRNEKSMPIIILSAKTEKDDKLNSLIFGADDYIEKPYDIDILIAKIKAIFRRNSLKNEVLTIDDISADLERRTVTKNGELISLTAKEFELLVFLMQNKGKTLNKDVIFNKTWGVDSFSEPSTLTVHIKWLRQKIEEDPKNPEHILTVWGVGYRFE